MLKIETKRQLFTISCKYLTIIDRLTYLFWLNTAGETRLVVDNDWLQPIKGQFD